MNPDGLLWTPKWSDLTFVEHRVSHAIDAGSSRTLRRSSGPWGWRALLSTSRRQKHHVDHHECSVLGPREARNNVGRLKTPGRHKVDYLG